MKVTPVHEDIVDGSITAGPNGAADEAIKELRAARKSLLAQRGPYEVISLAIYCKLLKARVGGQSIPLMQSPKDEH